MLRVATFNVLHGRTSRTGPVDVPALAAACAGLDADVLALQEVDRGARRSGRADLAGEVAGACRAAHVFGPAVRRWLRGDYGNALVVRGSIDDVRVLRLPRHGRHEPRAAILARVTAGGLALSVAATHLSIHGAESADQLARLLEALAARPRPRLLLGDLNRRPDQLEALAAAGYTLAGGGPSYPAHAPRIRIDHVAVDGLELVSAAVVAVPASDHRAVVAEITS